MDFEGATLHFHMQCFDGVVSAVIARAYLTGPERWPEPTLIPVTYTVQQDWLKRAFGPRTAIVDFLFHPEATFWVDHHETAFVGAPPQRMEPLWFYDAKADSCAGLLARVLPERGFDPQRFSELISWSERIAAACRSCAIRGASSRASISGGCARDSEGEGMSASVRRHFRRPTRDGRWKQWSRSGKQSSLTPHDRSLQLLRRLRVPLARARPRGAPRASWRDDRREAPVFGARFGACGRGRRIRNWPARTCFRACVFRTGTSVRGEARGAFRARQGLSGAASRGSVRQADCDHG